jgi:hypothetical protein
MRRTDAKNLYGALIFWFFFIKEKEQKRKNNLMTLPA